MSDQGNCFEILQYVPDDEWPYEISDGELSAVNSILPPNLQFVREVSHTTSGYYLLEYKFE